MVRYSQRVFLVREPTARVFLCVCVSLRDIVSGGLFHYVDKNPEQKYNYVLRRHRSRRRFEVAHRSFRLVGF